ncbi:MAG: CooT family nickel-binding protein [Candidatus Helarchaeota archaeon]|nr:CooT family nickel-binding protein [Candidatus Helarchaeota archaeon]
MCEFKVVVKEPGKKEYLAIEEISYLKIQEDDGSILLKGLGIQKKIDTAIMKEINVFGEDGAIAKVFKTPIIGDFLKFLNKLEPGSYSPELEKTWMNFVTKGNELIRELKSKS